MTQQEFFNRFTYSVRTDKIGGGGFGNVYRAYDNTLHREVAIKVSEVKTTNDGQKTFSLKDEFEALAHVPKHPNIANYEEFYSFESPQGVFDYAVMQYYPGGNLTDAIRQGLTLEQKEEVARQLLEGIGFLHAHQVVHRDLKPGNILIVRHGGKVIPLITDFGLSKAANTGNGSMFSNSFGGGTQRYSSPEQLQGKPLRFNTDLWSFGAILYELFTGEQLFTASSGAADTAAAELEIYNKIIHGDVRALYGLPEKWRRVAERCLVVNPEQRARSVEELQQLVAMPQAGVDNGGGIVPPVSPVSVSEETVVGSGTAAAPTRVVADENTVAESSSAQPQPQPQPQSLPRKRKVWPWVLAVLAVLAVAVVVILVMPGDRGKDVKVKDVSRVESGDTVVEIDSNYVIDIDGNRYRTVKIGDQIWMAENMRAKHDRDGNFIREDSDYRNFAVPCRYNPGNNDANVKNYGFLYNFCAALKVCPQGWHLPFKEEWEQLEDYVSCQKQYLCDGKRQYSCGEKMENNAKSLASTYGWKFSKRPCAVGSMPNDNNMTGFSAPPSGMRGDFIGDRFGDSAYYWCNDSIGGGISGKSFSPGFCLEHDNAYVYICGNFGHGCEISVRCVRD